MDSLINIIPENSFELLNTFDPYRFVEYLIKVYDISERIHTGCEYEIMVMILVITLNQIYH